MWLSVSRPVMQLGARSHHSLHTSAPSAGEKQVPDDLVYHSLQLNHLPSPVPLHFLGMSGNCQSCLYHFNLLAMSGNCQSCLPMHLGFLVSHRLAHKTRFSSCINKQTQAYLQCKDPIDLPGCFPSFPRVYPFRKIEVFSFSSFLSLSFAKAGGHSRHSRGEELSTSH